MTISISLLLSHTDSIEEAMGTLIICLTNIIKLFSVKFFCQNNGLCNKAYIKSIRASM